MMRQTDKHMDVLKGRYKGYYKLTREQDKKV